MNNTGLIYGIRDVSTGKLVSDINANHSTYYKSLACAQNAVQAYNARKAKTKHGRLEVVAFSLTEIAIFSVG